MRITKNLAYIAGLWKADRGSTAKGVVAIKNKQWPLLKKFRKFLEKLGNKVKEREVVGYSRVKEVYTCDTSLRRQIEHIIKNRETLTREKLLAYFGGMIDGDGTVDANKSVFRIYYSHNEEEDAEKDKRILMEKFKQEAVVKRYNVPTLCIHNPRKFARMILPFVNHPAKRRELLKMT